MLPIPLSPQPLKIPLFTVFSSIFPRANAGSQLQHIYKKSFQNIVFDSVFPMFPVKQTVIYTFFAIKAVIPSKHGFWQCFCNASSQAYGNLHVFCYNVSPKHLFLQCFQCSGIQKPCKILLCTIFGRFSFAGKLPKWPKIPFQYPLALRHPKIIEKCRKHHRILVSVRNRFWAPQLKLI